jgi:RNase H-like domain found in reverse transcriptase/Reverse transcriptase (RNA-dependent DNA polymerase)
MSQNNIVTDLSFIWIILVQQNKAVRALPDQGSQCNLINAKCIVNRHLIKPINISLKSATGDNLNVLGRVDEVLRMGNINISLPFLVVESFPYEMLISNQAMKEYSAIMNYATKTCTFTNTLTGRTSDIIKMFTIHATKYQVNMINTWLNNISITSNDMNNISRNSTIMEPVMQNIANISSGNTLKCREIEIRTQQISDNIFYHYLKNKTIITKEETIYLRINGPRKELQWNIKLLKTRARAFRLVGEDKYGIYLKNNNRRIVYFNEGTLLARQIKIAPKNINIIWQKERNEAIELVKQLSTGIQYRVPREVTLESQNQSNDKKIGSGLGEQSGVDESRFPKMSISGKDDWILGKICRPTYNDKDCDDTEFNLLFSGCPSQFTWCYGGCSHDERPCIQENKYRCPEDIYFAKGQIRNISCPQEGTDIIINAIMLKRKGLNIREHHGTVLNIINNSNKMQRIHKDTVIAYKYTNHKTAVADNFTYEEIREIKRLQRIRLFDINLITINPEIPIEWQKKFRALHFKYASIFAAKTNVIHTNKIFQMSISIKEECKGMVIRRKPYKLSFPQLQIQQQIIQQLLDDGNIVPSQSEFSASSFLVLKKPDESYTTLSDKDHKADIDVLNAKNWRYIIDYSPINKLVNTKASTLVSIESVHEYLSGMNWISGFDLSSAFYQIPLEPESRKYLAFMTQDGASYEWTCAPFGFLNCPLEFQVFMNKAFGKIQRDHAMGDNKFCFFQDDVLTLSNSLQGLYNVSENYYQRSQEIDVVSKITKIKVAMNHCKILGILFNKGVLQIDTARIAVIQRLAIPKTLKDVRSIIGTFSYNRDCINKFSDTIAPLVKLTKTTEIEYNGTQWGDEQQFAFDALKKAMCNAPALLTWRHDPENWTPALHCDASRIAIGGTLALINNQNGIHHPVRYASKLLNACQSKCYSVTEIEYLALVVLLTKWRHMLCLTKVQVFLDHRAILSHEKFDEKTPRLLKLKMQLTTFQLDIKYVKGKSHIYGDFPSRHVPLYTDDELYDDEIISRKIEEVGWCLYPDQDEINEQKKFEAKTPYSIHLALIQAQNNILDFDQECTDASEICGFECPKNDTIIDDCLRQVIIDKASINTGYEINMISHQRFFPDSPNVRINVTTRNQQKVNDQHIANIDKYDMVPAEKIHYPWQMYGEEDVKIIDNIPDETSLIGQPTAGYTIEGPLTRLNIINVQKNDKYFSKVYQRLTANPQLKKFCMFTIDKEMLYYKTKTKNSSA